MSTKQADTGEVKRKKVTLIAAHTHGDQDYKVGDTIEVTPIEKDWLIRHERIAPAEQAPAATKAKE
ncbi:hypothetical protein [Pseudomonas sp. 273]|uniref:DUF7210 family protein n=1 Tax=Pseudomonas sp. 273 TaxID=75692 RepID=UPI0023D86B72|nr:hypothetical protein [Pseudomonas sp. 273]